MKKLIFVSIFIYFNSFSQTGKIFIETNYNTFSHYSLSDFQKEFKNDIPDIPIQTTDDFPSNIGFTIGYELSNRNIAFFLGYNSTGGKLSYSDFSGVIRIEEPLKAITFGGIYYLNISDKKDFRIGFKGFTMLSNFTIDSYSKIGESITKEVVDFQSFDIGIGAQLNYEHPLTSFLILKANLGFDLVLGNKLMFNKNKEYHLTNNADEQVNTGWSGLRTGIGIAVPIN
jgi:hypothetical protein